MEQKNTAQPNYKEENERIKKAYKEEEDFIMDEMMEDAERNTGEVDRQNLQSNIEKAIDKES